MNSMFTGNSFLMIIIFAFIAVVLLLEGLYFLWNSYKGPEAKRIERRLQALSAGGDNAETSIIKQKLLQETPTVEKWLLSMPRIHNLDKLMIQAGLSLTISKFLVISVATGVIGFILGTILIKKIWFAGIILGIVAATTPFFYILNKKSKRMNLIEQQLPDTLDLICRALKAGHAFSSGLKMVGDEMSEPIANEFRITHDEINFGVSMQQALLNLGERIPSTDLRYFVIAVLIQKESGGNLTEILGNLSALIRERHKLYMRIKVLSAEGKLSAWIICLLPFVLAGIINVINPKFMTVLWTDPMGHKMIAGMLISMFIGILWLRKIIKIHV